MNKSTLFSLFAAVLFATSMWAADEGPWTRMAMKHGACPKGDYLSMSYDGLGNNGAWGEIQAWNDGDGIGYTQKGSSPGGSRKQGVFSVYKVDKTLEPFSKQVLTWKYRLGSNSKKHYSCTALYAVQGAISNANSLYVDFTDDMSNGAGSANRLYYYVNTYQDNSPKFTSEREKTFAFDNSTGASQASKTWCLLLTHVVSCGSIGKSSLHEWGSFLHVSEAWTTYYYKYVTFDGNGASAGSMTQQTVENSAALKANAFSRTGYTFDGWATSATGSKAYNNKANITANSSSKGYVTLYAHWVANQYTVTLDLQGAQSGTGSVTATYASGMPAMTVPARKGYTFMGYYDGKNGTGTKYYNADGSSAKNWDKTVNTTLYAYWTIDPNTTVLYKDSLGQTIAQEVAAFNRPEAPVVAGFTFLRWEVKEAPLSEGIELYAIYKDNNASGAPKRTVGKFTLIRKEGAENEYILQTAK